MRKKNKDRMKKNGNEPQTSVTIINSKTRILGKIFSEANLRVDGTIEGNINCSSKVNIGPSAKIIGDIVCQQGEIECEVQGNIFCEDQLKLNATANISGDIYTKRLIVESGALFNGKCEMGQTKAVEDYMRENYEPLQPQNGKEEEKPLS
jgi:cytoskeletal protein CcmA (bactofilin family)